MLYAKEVDGSYTVKSQKQISIPGVSGIQYASQEKMLEYGWKPYLPPTLNEGETYGIFIENETEITRGTKTVPAVIPEIISKLNFKIGLLQNHGITNDAVDQVINAVEDTAQKEMLKLLWYENTTVDRTDPNLLMFAPFLGLTEEDLEVICRDYQDYR